MFMIFFFLIFTDGIVKCSAQRHCDGYIGKGKLCNEEDQNECQACCDKEHQGTCGDCGQNECICHLCSEFPPDLRRKNN
jgi:hypothetical protein